MYYRTEDAIEGGVQMFAEIFGEEAENVTAIFLKQGILAAVAAVGGVIREVLRSIDLDGEFELGAKQVDFYFAPAVERDGEFGIQSE